MTDAAPVTCGELSPTARRPVSRHASFAPGVRGLPFALQGAAFEATADRRPVFRAIAVARSAITGSGGQHQSHRSLLSGSLYIFVVNSATPGSGFCQERYLVCSAWVFWGPRHSRLRSDG